MTTLFQDKCNLVTFHVTSKRGPFTARSIPSNFLERLFLLIELQLLLIQSAYNYQGQKIKKKKTTGNLKILAASRVT